MTALSMTFTASPVLAAIPFVIEEPGGTTITVIPDQVFTLQFKLQWNEPLYLGYFSLGINWDSPKSDSAGTASENFSFVSAFAYFEDNLDPISVNVTFSEGQKPENENMWGYSIVVDHTIGDGGDDNFYVEIVMRASGYGGVLHVPTDNHPIVISGPIDILEELYYHYFPPNPYITIRVLPAWRLIENWKGDIEVPAEWQLIENLTGTVQAPSLWRLIELWTVTIEAPAQWQPIETWTGTIRTIGWKLIETWTGIIEVPANWELIETWTGAVEAPAAWQLVETWTGTVKAPAEWQLIETWAGAVKAHTKWQLIETWTGTIESPYVWGLIETWTGSLHHYLAQVTTEPATDITQNSATLNASIDYGNFSDVDIRFQYMVQGASVWENTNWTYDYTQSSYSDSVSGLSPSTTYEFRGHIQFDSLEDFGDILEFTTQSPPPPPPPPAEVD